MAKSNGKHQVFEKIELEWAGQKYAIPPDRVMGAIMRIEDVVTLGEIGAMVSSPNNLKFGKIATAYGSVLRYAGAQIEDTEVYAGLFAGTSEGEGRKHVAVNALIALMAMMVPDSVVAQVKKTTGGEAAAGKQEPVAGG